MALNATYSFPSFSLLQRWLDARVYSCLPVCFKVNTVRSETRIQNTKYPVEYSDRTSKDSKEVEKDPR